MKALLNSLFLMTAVLLAGCGKSVEVDLDKPVDVPEISWELPSGWRVEKTDSKKNPWHFYGPDRALVSVMHLENSGGVLSIWGVTKAWRKTLDLAPQSKDDLNKSLKFLDNDVITYKIDDGVEAIFGAFYTLNGNLWILRYDGKLKTMRGDDFDDIAGSLELNEELTLRIQDLEKLEDPRAYMELARYYAAGKGVERNVENLKKYLRKAREAGEVEASYRLALLAIKEKKTEKAVEYLSEGVKKQHIESLKTLAGIVIEQNQDVEFARKLLKDAADQGDADAMYYLASLDLEFSPQERKDEIVSWIQKAADKEHPPAMTKLAEFYLTGFGVEKDTGKATGLYEKAAAFKYMKAVETLGHLYLSGQYVQKDLKKALTYLFDAASLGSTKSLVSLSAMYFNGEGVEKNNDEGFKLLEEAVRAGDPQAMVVMGNIFYHGIFTKKNLEMAFRLYSQSAASGSVEGMYKTGQSLLLGNGCEKNASDGVKWLKKAAAGGHKDAQKLLKDKNL